MNAHGLFLDIIINNFHLYGWIFKAHLGKIT